MEVLLALVLSSFWSTEYFHSEEAASVFCPPMTSLQGDDSCSCIVWAEFSVALEERWCCSSILDCCVQAADKSVFLLCAAVEMVLLTFRSWDLHILALFIGFILLEYSALEGLISPSLKAIRCPHFLFSFPHFRGIYDWCHPMTSGSGKTPRLLQNWQPLLSPVPFLHEIVPSKDLL